MAGLLGYGGMSGSFGAQPPAGLLGKYYDPKIQRQQQIKQGLLNAGIAMLQNGKGSTGEVLGNSLAGGLQGAQTAGINYKQDAMGYQQLEQQMTEQKRKDAEYKEKEKQKAAIMQMISEDTPENQQLAMTNPQAYAELRMKQQFTAKEPKDLQSVGKGSTLYDPNTKTWISPPAGTPGATQAIDDPLKISKNYEGSPGMSRIAQIAPTIQSMQKSLTDPSAMADLDFVYGLAKILDPTSVVRESEGKMVIESQGLGPQLLGQLNKLMSGEQAMLPEIREKLFSVAYRRAKELELQAQGERKHFSGVATENQFNPETYLQQVPQLPQWNPTTNQTPPAGKTSTGVPWSIVP